MSAERRSDGRVGSRAGGRSARRRRRTAPPIARVARTRQRPPDHPRAGAVVARRPPAVGHDARVDERHRGPARGLDPGPTIILRGDMDALPMPEDTGLDFASHVDGCMHACGHDTHTAMLSGAAHLLSERRDELRRPGAVHVPTGRGGPPRRPVHARRGPARRSGAAPTGPPRRSTRRSPCTSRRPSPRGG